MKPSMRRSVGALSPIGHIDPAVFEQVMAVNVTANWRLIRSIDPLLRASDAGRAIHLTTSVATAPRAFWGMYAATKAGAEALVKCWADEIESTLVRAAIVDPGRMRTQLRAQAYPGEDPDTLPKPADIAGKLVALLQLPSMQAARNASSAPYAQASNAATLRPPTAPAARR